MTRNEVLSLWHKTERSKDWGAPDYVNQCLDRPGVYWIGGNTEVFDVIDEAGRVLSEDEFPSSNFERLKWRELQ